MAKVINFFDKKRENFKAEITLNERELNDLRWILINSKSLMKLWDKDHNQNAYNDDLLKINLFLEAIRHPENKFEE